MVIFFLIFGSEAPRDLRIGSLSLNDLYPSSHILTPSDKQLVQEFCTAIGILLDNFAVLLLGNFFYFKRYFDHERR